MTIALAEPPSLTPAQRRRHWDMLVISSLAIVLSFTLSVRPDGRVAFRGWADHPVPETCLAKAMFHVECPACGLTRSFVSLARGDWAGSWAYNRCGILLALACLIQVPYRSLSLAAGRTLVGAKPSMVFGYVLIGALVVNWIFNQFVGHAG